MRKRQTQPPVALVQPEQLQLLDIPAVAKLLCVGRTKVYRLIRTEGLPTIRVGSAIRVKAASLQHWLEQREHAAS